MNHRRIVEAYLGIGSNLGYRLENLARGVASVARLSGVSVQKVSSIYETEPVGITDQPMFLNAAMKLTTCLRPRRLLADLKRVERRVGRTPGRRWGPRVLDIDILLYGDLVYSDPQLQVPHSQMSTRRFVLTPLAELCPQVVLPSNSHTTVSELLVNCPDTTTVEFFSSPPKIHQTKSWGLP